MRTTAGIHTQPGDTPTANLRTLGDHTYLDVNLAGHPEADATLYIGDPAYLDALLDVLSVKAAEWKLQRGEPTGRCLACTTGGAAGRAISHTHGDAS